MTQSASRPDIRFGEFVAIVAALMAINALGIDTMLPALPQIGAALHVAIENQRQFIITAYVLGFGIAQIVYGPLADRYGRRPVLLVSLTLFVVMSFAVTFATDLHQMVLGRVLQGIGAAGTRVLSSSIVRDRFQGRTMARVMSLAFTVFLAVPILAPNIGQLILLIGPWPWIFYLLTAFGAILMLWLWIRLPETLNPAFRRDIDPRTLAAGFRAVLTNRTSLGYSLATACSFGALLGFINTVQQIFAEVFHRPEIFTYVFAAAAAGMGGASVLNARIVERVGTRRVSHTALLCFIAISIAHMLFYQAGLETWLSFSIFQAAVMFCFALCGSNFGAMAMEPVGHLAGTAASIQGAISTVGGGVLGLVVSQRFDGTVLPTMEGYVGLGVLALLIVLFTEHGRLFRPHHALAPA